MVAVFERLTRLELGLASAPRGHHAALVFLLRRR